MIGFKFTPVEVNLILKGLLELPAKESIDLIIKIDAEAKKQAQQNIDAEAKSKGSEQ